MLRKLAAVMFYASVPLWLAFFYSFISPDDGWIPIGLTLLIMGLPAVPQILRGMLENTKTALRSLVHKDTPFNYAKVLDTESMRKEVETLTFGEVLALTALAWILVPFLSVFPYIYYGVPVLDAFFESVSGWTSTGLSALPTVAIIPKSVIFFRSITQWVGGLGIVVLILSTTKGREAISFLRAEGRSQTELGIAQTVSTTFNVYFVLTILGIILCLIVGFDPFNAVNLTFAAIANGGFFPFDSYPLTDIQKLALAAILFAGATSVLFFRSVWQGMIAKAFSDEELVLYAGLTALAVILMLTVGGEGGFNALLNGVAAITGGGFGIGDLTIMHTFGIYVLIILMLSGGMTGSTTGAIKLWRVLVIMKAVWKQVKESFMPAGSVQVVKINYLPINERMIVESAIFVFAYLLVFLAASGAFMTAAYGTEDSMFLVATAMGNVGLSTVSIPAVGAAGKSLLIFLMYIGRIEIFPSLALVAFITRR
ncbi:MAG: potassium transporter TrkG [Candidatus Micrarchaeota archaeon]